MGGNVKYAVSGSAPLGPRLGHFYHALGITILEGYGLTETTAPATVNLATKSKIGTVGPALPGVSVRIADDGEIEVKGINVFKEYWKNPAATAETFDGDWFKTGDLGSFDGDGFLTITGRKKEIIVTAGGKNVAPAALEDPIRANPLVGQVVVVGDKKPFISALITLDPEMLPVWLNNNDEDAGMTRRGGDASTPRCSPRCSARSTPPTRTSRAPSRSASSRSSRRELTEASGHLTPKLSIKRNVILEDFSGEIEAMYSGAPGHRGPLDRALSIEAREGPRGIRGALRRLGRRRRPPRGARESEPVRLAHLLHRRPSLVLLEPVEVEDAVEVVGLVLQRLRHEAAARRARSRCRRGRCRGPGRTDAAASCATARAPRGIPRR